LPNNWVNLQGVLGQREREQADKSVAVNEKDKFNQRGGLQVARVEQPPKSRRKKPEMLPNSNAYCDKRPLPLWAIMFWPRLRLPHPQLQVKRPPSLQIANVAAVSAGVAAVPVDVAAVAGDSLQVVQLFEMQFHAQAKIRKIKNESWARLAFECNTTEIRY